MQKMCLNQWLLRGTSVALEQSAYINLERTGELHDIFNSEIAFPAFDPGVALFSECP